MPEFDQAIVGAGLPMVVHSNLYMIFVASYDIVVLTIRAKI